MKISRFLIFNNFFHCYPYEVTMGTASGGCPGIQKYVIPESRDLSAVVPEGDEGRSGISGIK